MALFDLVGRRWALRVVWELLDGDATFRDLAHRCDDVSSSVLRDRLRDLTAAGIVERGDGGYRLTADGRELVEVLRPLGEWSQRWAARSTSTTSASDLIARRRHLPTVDPDGLRRDLDAVLDAEL